MAVAQAMRIAITRQVSAALANCERSFAALAPVALTLAIKQQQTYLRGFESLRCEVISMPAQGDLTDMEFVEYVAPCPS
jgi:dimethylargininase